VNVICLEVEVSVLSKRNSLLLTSVNAPTAQKTYCEVPKKLKIHFGLDNLCLLTKFHEKGIFSVASIKRQILMLQNYYLREIFVFLHMPQKIYFIGKTFWVNMECSDVHSKRKSIF
jgi:hypothetical protein